MQRVLVGHHLIGPFLADRLADELLHPDERFGGLRGPAPLALRRGIGDGLQLTQGVRAAQLMIRGRVRVIRRPGVDGDPGEPGKDAHRLDRPPAAPGVDHEQGVSAGAGAVHPGQAALHPEPGLVGPGHLADGDLPADVLQEPVQPPGRAGCQRPDRPDDSGMPNSSPSASAVRSLDRNCPACR